MALVAALLAVMVGLSDRAQAQPVPSERDIQRMTKLVVTGVEETGRAIWNTTTGFIGGLVGGLRPSSLGEIVDRFTGRDGDIWRLLDAAGYEVSRVERKVGLIPSIRVDFVRRRELSHFDRDYLDREVDRFSERNRGVFSRLERSIIDDLLDVDETDALQVTAVEFELFPVPSVRYVLTPPKRLP